MHKIRNIIIGILICCSLFILGMSINQHRQNVNAQKNNVVQSYKVPKQVLVTAMTMNHVPHKSKEQKYRIYSHHYLAIEHHDLEALRTVWNKYAKHANYLSENNYDTNGGIIYHKFNDGNYWSAYRDVKVPGNFKESHMNNRTYYYINKRVLKAHGVFKGINIKHNKKVIMMKE